nr:MAG: RNA-dependent RNA polymerase [Beetle aliusvirus]
MTAQSQPATRVTYDAHAFMSEEKFDKWLDLSIISDFRTKCIGASNWTTKIFSDINHIVSADTICELHHLGLSPQYITSCQITPLIPAMIISQTLDEKPSKSHLNSRPQREFNTIAQEAAFNATSHQVAHLLSHTSPTLKDMQFEATAPLLTKLMQLSDSINAAQTVQEDMLKCLEIHRRLLEYSPLKSSNQRASFKVKKLNLIQSIPSLSAKIIITHDVFILILKGKKYLLDNDMFLQIVNKSSELFALLSYTFLCAGSTKPQNHHTICVEFLKHLCDKLLYFKCLHSTETTIPQENRGFVYLKTMEGLGVAELIIRSDRMINWDNTSLAENLWTSILGEQLDFCELYHQSQLWALFHQMSTSQIASLIGIVKIVGHPSVEVMKGLYKLNQRVHETIIINPDAVARSMGVLKRELVINYHKKHGTYPFIDLNSPLLHPEIFRLYTHDIGPDTNIGMQIRRNLTIIDWNSITLLKNELFDPIDNQLILLKDKALGLCRSQVLKLFFSETTTSTSLGAMEYRRALLLYLMSSHFSQDFTSYFDNFQHDDPWKKAVLDYLVIKLTPKELELKIEGRMFGASHLNERNRRITQDANIMHLLDCYFIDQLMTPDELLTIRRLYSFRHIQKAYPNHTVVQVSFDFSKWNNSMRSASIDVPGAEVFDRWFGTQCYGKTMRAFENMFVYYKDPKYLYSWDGQEGGIEGLAQATWSAIFIGGIKQALENLGVTYQLTVKGDDVRAALICDQQHMTQEDLIQFRNRTLEQLQRLCNDMGWQLNPHECFVSVGVICTSKQYQFFDTWLPADDKKMMKCESMANLVFPTVEDVVSSVYSTAHSACSQATAILPAYCTATYIASRVLLRDMMIYKITSDQLTTLLLWPQVLGGPGALPLQTFIVRGENDMVAVSISLLRHVVASGFGHISTLCLNLFKIPMEKIPNLNQLLSDPYALPLQVPDRPSQVLKNLMHSFLSRWVKNPDVKKLLTTRTLNDKKIFAKLLLSMDPFYPKLATAIWECTPFVLIDEIISKFMQSSTIFVFFSKGKKGNMSAASAAKALTAVLIAAKKRKIFWHSIIKHTLPDDRIMGAFLVSEIIDLKTLCSTTFVNRLRSRLWKRDLLGITYPSLVDQNMIYHSRDLEHAYDNVRTEFIATQVSLLCKYSTCQTVDDESLHFSSAPDAIPWLGSVTQSKLIFPKFDYRIKSPVLNKILRLVGLLRSGAFFGTKFGSVLREVLSGLTYVSLDRLQVLQPETGGGHLCHRVSINAFSMNTMPNYRPNLSQLISVNNESLKLLQLDRRDRTINFAARHFFLIVMCLFPLQSNMVMPENYPDVLEIVFHHDTQHDNYRLCPDCCAIALDEEIDIDLTYSVNLAEYRDLKLVGCSDFETYILNSNIISAIVHKARHQIIDRNLDLDNMRIRSAAFESTIRSLYLENTSLYNSARAAMFEKIPQGELLNILSCNFIGTSPGKKVSMRLIRSIPPLELYQNVLTIVFHHFLKALSTIKDIAEIVSLRYIQVHLINISGLFQSISNAGCLKNISLGALETNLLDSEFVWSVGSSNSGGLACKSFINQHLSLFQHWWITNTQPVFIKYFLQNDDNDIIRTELRERLDIIRSCATRRVLYSGEFIGISRRLVRSFCDILNINEQILMTRCYDQVSRNNTIADLLEIHVNELINQENFLQTEFCHDVTLYISALHTFMSIFDSEQLNDPGMNYLETLVYIDLLEENISGHIILHTIPEHTALEKTLAHVFGVHLNDDVFMLLMDFCVFMGNEIGLCEVAQERWRDQLHSTREWVRINSRIFINTLSFESSERVLDKLAEQAPHELLHDFVNLPERDHMGDNIIHNIPLFCDQIGCTNIRAINRPLYMNVANPFETTALIQVRESYLPYIVATQTRRDYPPLNEMWRVSPTLNQACSAWQQVFVKNRGLLSNIWLAAMSTFLIVGDGSGAISRWLLEYNTNLDIVFCSLNINPTTGHQQQDSSTTNAPYEFLRGYSNNLMVGRLHWTGMYPGDITSPDVRSIVGRNISNCPGLFYGIVSDAEPRKYTYLNDIVKILLSLLAIRESHGSTQTALAFKMQLTDDITTARIIMILHRYFSHVHMDLPPSTNANTKVVYILCENGIHYKGMTNDIEKFIAGTYSLYVDENLQHYLRRTLAVINDTEIRRVIFGELLIDNQIWNLRRLTRTWFQCSSHLKIVDYFHITSTSRCLDLCDVELTIGRDCREALNTIISLIKTQLTQERGDNRPVRFKRTVQLGFDKRKIAEGRTYILELLTGYLRLSFLNSVLNLCGLNSQEILNSQIPIVIDWIAGIFDMEEQLLLPIQLQDSGRSPKLRVWGTTIDTRLILRSNWKYIMRLIGQIYHNWAYIRTHEDIDHPYILPWWGGCNVNPCCLQRSRHILNQPLYPDGIRTFPSIHVTHTGLVRLLHIPGVADDSRDFPRVNHPLHNTYPDAWHVADDNIEEQQ